MKIDFGTQDIEVNALSVEEKFDVEVNAQFFRTMTDTLYSYKVRAIVRELSTNAFDAMVDVGKQNTPFHVHLPNRLETFFSVRDFGPGIAPEHIKSVYTTLFKSSRIKSQDHAGCYGLGSKSPFCKVDMFTVTSYYNGHKYIYSMYKNEQKIPSVVLLAQETTDEPNGLEVSVPVEICDIGQYLTEAVFVYRTFKTRPKIVGATLDFKDHTPQLKGSCWELYNGNNNAVAVMGNVSYPLDGATEQLPYNYKHNYILDSPFVIHFDIGEVDIPPSREALSYDKNTIESVKNKLIKVQQEILKQVQDNVDAEKNYWDACVKYNQYSYAVYNIIDTSIKYKNKDISTSFSISDKYTLRMFWRQNDKRRTKYLTEINIKHNDNPIVVFDDVADRSYSRIYNYLDDPMNKDKTVYLISVKEGQTATAKDVCDLLGKDSIDLVSALPLPPKKVYTGVSGPRQRQPIKYYDIKNEKEVSGNIILNGGEYYLYTDRNDRGYKGYGNGTFYSHSNMVEFINEYNELFKDNISIDKILLVKKYNFEIRVKKFKMQNLYESVINLVKNKVATDKTLEKYSIDLSEFDDYYGTARRFEGFCRMIDKYKFTVPKSIEQEYNFCKHKTACSEFVKFCKEHKITIGTPKQKFSMKTSFKNRPLLRIILENCSYVEGMDKSTVKDILDYLS